MMRGVTGSQAVTPEHDDTLPENRISLSDSGNSPPTTRIVTVPVLALAPNAKINVLFAICSESAAGVADTITSNAAGAGRDSVAVIVGVPLVSSKLLVLCRCSVF